VRDLDNLISQQRMAAACSPDGGTRGPPPFLPHVLGVPPPSHVKFLSSDDEEDEEVRAGSPSAPILCHPTSLLPLHSTQQTRQGSQGKVEGEGWGLKRASPVGTSRV
jgi:hypothetical protein